MVTGDRPPHSAHEPFRVGLLGASSIAPVAIIEPARARNDIAVVAVASRDPARADAYARRHGIARAVVDYRQLLELPIDLVYIGLPPSEHARWAVEALRAGKGVLCEKPLALNFGEAVRMVETAQALDLPLIEAFHYRYHPAFERVRALVREGAIGRVAKAFITMSSSVPYATSAFRWNARRGGGVSMDLGCYAVHALRMLFGDEPEPIEASADFDREVDIRFRGSLRFLSGTEASFAVSMVGDDFAQELRIDGSDGSIVFPWFAMPQSGDAIRIENVDGVRHEPVALGSSFDHQLAHVVEVLRGNACPLTGGADSVSNLRSLGRLRELAGISTIA